MPLWHIGYWIKVTKSWLVQEKCWPSPVPLKTINKLTMWKTPFLYRKVERDLHHQRYGIKVCKGCINSRMVSLLSYYAQAQTSFSCHFLTNTLFLCLKAIKIICFGLFFESHISMISYIYKIWVCFFLLLIKTLCQFNLWSVKEPRREEEKVSPQNNFSFPNPGLHLLKWYQFSRLVVSDYLQPHESQHARPPCPSPTPGLQSNSCPLSRWCHPAISSSVIPFSSCPFPASGSFPMSQLFAWGGQSIGVSASASVLPTNTQDWSPLEWTGWISLQSKGLSRIFSNTTLQKHQFFSAQLSSQSNSHIHTWPLEKP